MYKCGRYVAITAGRLFYHYSARISPQTSLTPLIADLYSLNFDCF